MGFLGFSKVGFLLSFFFILVLGLEMRVWDV